MEEKQNSLIDYYFSLFVNQKSDPFNTEPANSPKYPSMYDVYLIDDEEHPANFTVYALMEFFNANYDDALQIICATETTGKGFCGTFTKEVAETKIMEITEYFREHGYCLNCQIEKSLENAIKKS